MELFTVMEVAKKLKTNKQRVYSLIKSGHLKALKLGDLKIPSFELDRFIQQSVGRDFTDLNNIIELNF